MGADRGILVKTDGDVEPLAVAKILKAICDAEQPGLAILGKQAIDDDSNQTGQMLAALLGWPRATFAHKLDLGDGTAQVEREIDGGLQTVEIKLPAVMTTDLRLNEPRYASLPKHQGESEEKAHRRKVAGRLRRRRHAAMAQGCSQSDGAREAPGRRQKVKNRSHPSSSTSSKKSERS